MGCHFLLQGIFLTQGSNPGLFCLLHWQVDSFPPIFADEEAETWGNNATWLGRTRASLGSSRLEVALALTPSKMSPFTCLSLTSRGRRVYKASVEIQASRANP